MLQWESTLELQGRYLKGFGEPPAGLVRFLDPKVWEIVTHLDAIVACIGVFHLSKPGKPPKS
jgi:hypothetical protein